MKRPFGRPRRATIAVKRPAIFRVRTPLWLTRTLAEAMRTPGGLRRWIGNRRRLTQRFALGSPNAAATLLGGAAASAVSCAVGAGLAGLAGGVGTGAAGTDG